jgi:hypothetical protein
MAVVIVVVVLVYCSERGGCRMMCLEMSLQR